MTDHRDMVVSAGLARIGLDVRRIAAERGAEAGGDMLIMADQAETAARQIEAIGPARPLPCGHTPPQLLRDLARRTRALARIFMPPSPLDAVWDLPRRRTTP